MYVYIYIYMYVSLSLSIYTYIYIYIYLPISFITLQRRDAHGAGPAVARDDAQLAWAA